MNKSNDERKTLESETESDTQALATQQVGRELVNEESLWLANFTSKATRRSYSLAFREFCALHQIKDSEAFRRTTAADIIIYRDHLINARQLSNRSIRNKMAALSSCFKYLQANNVIDRNPVDGIERPKVDDRSGETPAMTNRQVRHFLAQPDINTEKGLRDSAILHFLFFTGSRIGSPGSIKIRDFFEDKGFYVLRWKKKGGTNQTIPVHPQLQAALLAYLEHSEHGSDADAPLFTAVKRVRNNGGALTTQQFRTIWHQLS